jgi:hypothetical protein
MENDFVLLLLKKIHAFRLPLWDIIRHTNTYVHTCILVIYLYAGWLPIKGPKHVAMLKTNKRFCVRWKYEIWLTFNDITGSVLSKCRGLVGPIWWCWCYVLPVATWRHTWTLHAPFRYIQFIYLTHIYLAAISHSIERRSNLFCVFVSSVAMETKREASLRFVWIADTNWSVTILWRMVVVVVVVVVLVIRLYIVRGPR